MSSIGIIIAVCTVMCLTVSVQCFEAGAKRIGATPVNIIRLSFANAAFAVILFFKNGTLIPMDFPAHAWCYLSLSGIIGFFLGDIFLFKAFVEIGPRVAMLIMSLSAPAAAILGKLFLNETYVLHQWAGMFITLAGVGLVILEKSRPENARGTVRQITPKGIILGMGGMLGQAVGYVMSKVGMQTDSGYLDAFSATQIRAIAALICFLLLFTFTRRWPQVRQAVKDTGAVGFIAVGSFMGPVLGISLSLLALHYIPTGIASTIMSLVPVCLIPFAVFLHREHVSVKAVAGALIAVFGVYCLSG